MTNREATPVSQSVKVDVTSMDPIVFANTWHAAEKLAEREGMRINYSKGAVYPFQLLFRENFGKGLVNDFKSILDLKAWLDRDSESHPLYTL